MSKSDLDSWTRLLAGSRTLEGGEVSNWPSGQYRTIYLDPPWPFLDQISPESRGALHFYSLLSVEKIKSLGIPSITFETCLIWMWIPRLFRRYGEEILEGWGFAPKTEWIWVKTTKDGRIRIGMGHYNRMAHEYLLLGTKGGAKPLNGKREPSVILAPREGHSKKPQVFYELIERNSLEPRIELFATSKRTGWEAWGHEIA